VRIIERKENKTSFVAKAQFIMEFFNPRLKSGVNTIQGEIMDFSPLHIFIY